MKPNKISNKILTVLLLLVMTSCSSNLISDEFNDGIDLEMQLSSPQTNIDINNQDVIENIRIIIAEQNSGDVVKNLKYELESNIKKFQLIIADIPAGLYKIYVFANEDVLEIVNDKFTDIDYIDNTSLLDNLQTESTIAHIQTRMPYAGKMENVQIDKKHVKISVPIIRLISKFIININNLDNKPIDLTHICLGNIMQANHYIFQNMFMTTSPNPETITIEANTPYQIRPQEVKEVITYVYQLKYNNFSTTLEEKSLTLGLKANDNRVYNPMPLTTNGSGITKINPNTTYKVNLGIKGDRIIGIEVEALKWDKVETDIPPYF